MFRFASPLFFCCLLLLAIIPVYRHKTLKPICINVSGLPESSGNSFFTPVLLTRLLLLMKLLAVVLMVTALARPQLGNRNVNVMTEGINIVLALDLSNSMSALDFEREGKVVDRLEAVKGVVSEFITKRSGDRIGMVVFGSNAFTQIPLTQDYNTISYVLDRLTIGMAGPATAIGDAIGISLKRLEDIESRSNIIILLTDGKSNAGEISWEAAADIAGRRNVKIYTIAVGTSGQAPYRVKGVFGDQYVYRKVEVDLKALETIAQKTSGRFFKADDTEGLKQIYGMIDRLETTKVEMDEWVEYKELYPWFVIPGMLLMFLYILLSNTRLIQVP